MAASNTKSTIQGGDAEEGRVFKDYFPEGVRGISARVLLLLIWYRLAVLLYAVACLPLTLCQRQCIFGSASGFCGRLQFGCCAQAHLRVDHYRLNNANFCQYIQGL